MTSIILCGCGGRMGKAVTEAAQNEYDIAAGVDVNASALSAACNFPVYESINDFAGKADVIVDFSHHSSLPALLDYSQRTHTPLVVATTGHTESELEMMKKASENTAIFFSGNFSIGINLIINLAKQAAKALDTDFDVEIIEKHHNKKLDAPSGTALMLANAISEERSDTQYVYDRHAVRKQRQSNEIGIHSVRGGTIVGEHEVIFAGANEVVTISHSAASREIFATGALRAAAYMAKKTSGLYSMDDLINGK